MLLLHHVHSFLYENRMSTEKLLYKANKRQTTSNYLPPCFPGVLPFNVKFYKNQHEKALFFIQKVTRFHLLADTLSQV